MDVMFEVTAKTGEEVIKQGDDGDNFYVIESGQFQVLRNSKVVNLLGMSLSLCFLKWNLLRFFVCFEKKELEEVLERLRWCIIVLVWQQSNQFQKVRTRNQYHLWNQYHLLNFNLNKKKTYLFIFKNRKIMGNGWTCI